MVKYIFARILANCLSPRLKGGGQTFNIRREDITFDEKLFVFFYNY